MILKQLSLIAENRINQQDFLFRETSKVTAIRLEMTLLSYTFIYFFFDTTIEQRLHRPCGSSDSSHCQQRGHFTPRAVSTKA